MRSLVAVASEKDDKFRRICVDTLCKLSVKNPALVADANGIKTLFHATLQSDCVEMVEQIIISMLYLYNSPSTRHLVNFELHLGILMAPFTDFDATAADAAQQLR